MAASQSPPRSRAIQARRIPPPVTHSRCLPSGRLRPVHWRRHLRSEGASFQWRVGNGASALLAALSSCLARYVPTEPVLRLGVGEQ
jgi:hypothetical protein